MMQPTREKLPDLIGKDASFFTEWLHAGFVGYLSGTEQHPPRSRLHVPGASTYIGLGEGLPDELAEIARALGGVEEIAFGQACARVLPKLSLDRDIDADIGELIILLAAQIRAYPVLRELAKLAPRTPDLPGADRLFMLAMDLVSDLAKPTYPEAAVCIERLIGADRLRLTRTQTERALIAMVGADTANLVRHLKFLSEPLDRDYGILEEPRKDRERMVDRCRLVLEVVDVALDPVVLAKSAEPGASRIGTAVDAGSRNDVRDWWAHTILEGSVEPLWDLRDRLGLPQPSIEKHPAPLITPRRAPQPPKQPVPLLSGNPGFRRPAPLPMGVSL
jgi:hypothetical protein